MKTITCGVDGSFGAYAALRVSASLADELGARLQFPQGPLLCRGDRLPLFVAPLQTTANATSPELSIQGGLR